MVEVPGWWVWVSGLYFVFSIVWSMALIGGMFMLYKKAMPVLAEVQIQVRRVSDQARSIAAKASSTAETVHVQTQHLLGNAQIARNQMTKQARTVGAVLTSVLVASRVVNLVRRMF